MTKKKQLSFAGMESKQKISKRKPSVNQMIVVELRRIADALETLAACAEDRRPPLEGHNE